MYRYTSFTTFSFVVFYLSVGYFIQLNSNSIIFLWNETVNVCLSQAKDKSMDMKMTVVTVSATVNEIFISFLGKDTVRKDRE